METDLAAGLLAEELARAQRDGVRNAADLPFFRHPHGAQAAVLLVHGFAATPWEMRPLADDLARRGFACLAVRLPGHATSPQDLAGRRWQEWLASVIDGFDLLAAGFPRVYGAGLSTGSLLLLLLAGARRPAGLALLSPYLRLRHRLAPLAGWLRHLYPYHQRTLAGDDAAHYYPERPLAGVHQINRLLRTLAPQLGAIDVPVLAMHGEGDSTVDIDSGRQLFERLGSQVRVYERFGPEAPHVLTASDNPYREAVLEGVGTFLEELERRAGAGNGPS